MLIGACDDLSSVLVNRVLRCYTRDKEHNVLCPVDGRDPRYRVVYGWLSSLFELLGRCGESVVGFVVEALAPS